MTFAKFLQLVRLMHFQSDVQAGLDVVSEELAEIKSVTNPQYLEASMFPPDSLRKSRFLVDTAVDVMGNRGVPADLPSGIKDCFVSHEQTKEEQQKNLARLTKAIRRKLIKLQVPRLFTSIELSLFPFSFFFFFFIVFV